MSSMGTKFMPYCFLKFTHDTKDKRAKAAIKHNDVLQSIF